VIRMTTKNIRCYSELITIPTFEGRFEYLKLDGIVGRETFGFDRYLNQQFYTSYEYRKFKRDIVIRDMGCDLGIEDRPIRSRIILHHINPISPEDILDRNIRILLDPENAICVSHRTHNAIHYGDSSLLITAPIERRPNDTCPWKY
jgi:ribosomal protein L20A (L18A)